MKTENHESTKWGRPTKKAVIARILAALVVLPGFFLITGGSLDWWQAWSYCAVILISATIFISYMARKYPEFLARRLKMKEKEGTQK